MNTYRQFSELFVTRKMLVGEIVSHNGDGTSTVDLIDGTTIRARGTSVTVGQKAFIRDGAVESQAPDLTVFNLPV